MAKKQTKGWVVKREPKDPYPEQWFYTRYGSPYKRRVDAVKRIVDLLDGMFTYRVYCVNMFYEPDDET